VYTVLQELKKISSQIEALQSKLEELKEAKQGFSNNWLDNADLKELLKVKDRTLQKYRDEGILPFTKLGGKILYRFEDVEKILIHNTQNG